MLVFTMLNYYKMELELDNKLSFLFDKLQMGTFEINNIEIDLVYKDKRHRIKYPMENPIEIILDNVFNQDNKLEIYVLSRESNVKLKKIAKGNINIYKKYFKFTDKYSVEKWVFLELNVETSKNGTQILQSMIATGKINMRVTLLNPPKEDTDKLFQINEEKTVYSSKTYGSVYSQALKANLKNIKEKKESVKANKTERLRSVTEHNNEFLKKLKTRKAEDIFGDNYIIDETDEKNRTSDDEDSDEMSDITDSTIDGSESSTHVSLSRGDLKVNQMILRIKAKYERYADKVFPQNTSELKEFIRRVNEKIENLSSYYTSNLNSIYDINFKLKTQAKNYYDQYKEIKTVFNKERKDRKRLEKFLEQETKLNKKENQIINKNLDDISKELFFFRNDNGIKIDSDLPKDQDLLDLTHILSSVNDTIEVPEDMNAEELKNYNDILNFYSISIEDEPNSLERYEKDQNLNEAENNRRKINELLIEGIEDYQQNTKNPSNINFFFVSENEIQLMEKRIVVNLLNDELQISEIKDNKETKYESFKEFLSKYFPGNKQSSVYNKNNTNRNSLEKHLSVQQKIERIKEQQMKILNGINKKGEGKLIKSNK